MKTTIMLPCLAATFLVTGCTKPVPSCNDEGPLSLVKQIADQEMTAQLGPEIGKLFSYSVNSIRTRSTDEKTGAHECAAELSFTASNTGVTDKLPITYTVELTDDGEEIYVEVYGL